MGRDFSLHQVDCRMALIRVYLNGGNLPSASKELRYAMQADKKDRIMMNHFRLTDCDLPVYVLEMFGYQSVTHRDELSRERFSDYNHARYMIMMVWFSLILCIHLD